MDPKTYRLCEAVVDIAWIAGAQRYHTGDSREDVANIIKWAEEFEAQFTQEREDAGEYMLDIEAWAEEKLNG